MSNTATKKSAQQLSEVQPQFEPKVTSLASTPVDGSVTSKKDVSTQSPPTSNEQGKKDSTPHIDKFQEIAASTAQVDPQAVASDTAERANITKLPFFTAFIGLVLVVSAGIGLYSMREEIGLSALFASKPTPTPTSIPSDPQADWKTYALKSVPFRFKLPQSVEASGSQMVRKLKTGIEECFLAKYTESQASIDSATESASMRAERNEICGQTQADLVISMPSVDVPMAKKPTFFDIRSFEASDAAVRVVYKDETSDTVPADRYEIVANNTKVKALVLYGPDDTQNIDQKIEDLPSSVVPINYIGAVVETHIPAFPVVYVLLKGTKSSMRTTFVDIVSTFEIEQPEVKRSGKLLVDPKSEFAFGNPYPSEISMLKDEELVQISCSTKYMKQIGGIYSDSSGEAISNDTVNNIFESYNKGKTDADWIAAGFLCTSESTTVLVYEIWKGGGGLENAAYVSKVDAKGVLTSPIRIVSNGAPYFGCSEPIALTKDDQFYLSCLGGDGQYGKKSLYQVDMGGASVKKLIEYESSSSQ